MTNIAIIGAGYVGLSNSVLLAQSNNVTIVDVLKSRVDEINTKRLYIKDKELQEYLSSKPLNLQATTDIKSACHNAEFVIIAVPTNYDPDSGRFDTSIVEAVAAQVIEINPDAAIVIKSTVPVGYTKSLSDKLSCRNILFSPEFLREGQALYDNLYPSRIIVGYSSFNKDKAGRFASLIKAEALKKDVEVLLMKSTEAEAVKLFSNTFLAMRISFFNELDSYAEHHELNTKSIIDGVCLDPRVGHFYNNPSFGYGGYCLPKDTKQLRANFNDVPHSIISAIVESNKVRKDFIADRIMAKNPQLVGVYRLAMKKDSDNYRKSSILGVIKRLNNNGIKTLIYEPAITGDVFFESEVIHDFERFKDICDVIIANRHHDELSDIAHKVYTRDLYFED
jgi:UDPglucose 6-dehydrogenase